MLYTVRVYEKVNHMNKKSLKGAFARANLISVGKKSLTVEELFIVPFEHPTYQSVHMVHIKHVLPLNHFDLGNHRNMYLQNARASTNMTLCTHINTYMRVH